ncbi:MAG: PrpR N-terminal domain-containing protein [Bacillota bacterium]
MDVMVGFIASDADLASRCAARASDLGVQCIPVVSPPEGYLRSLREIESGGCNAVVAPSQVVSALQGRSRLPMVPLSPGPYDVLRAIGEARTLGDRIALLHFGPGTLPVQLFRELVGTGVTEITPGRSRDQILSALKDSRTRGLQVVVGGQGVASLASWTGLEAVEIRVGPEALTDAVARAVEMGRVTKRLSSRLQRLTQAFPGAEPRALMPALVTESPAMKEVRPRLVAVATREEPVLFLGETGTGRQFWARQVHLARGRPAASFVSLECLSLACDEAEAALSHALARAKGGTLFLANVTALPRDTRRRVRGLLQMPFPAAEGILLCASAFEGVQGLGEDPDLLGSFPLSIPIPPLRQRTGDIEALFCAFVQELAPTPGEMGPFLDVGFLSDAGWSRLKSYDWPGNVRELRNLAIRYVTLSGALPRALDEVEREVLQGLEVPATGPGYVQVSVGPLEDMVDEILRKTLASADGNRSEVARRLSISRTTLWKRLKKRGDVTLYGS